MNMPHSLFYKDAKDIELLTEEQTNKLLCIYKRSNNIKAKNMLIEHNIKLVLHIAQKKGYNHNIPFDELVSTGIMGLIKAIENFDMSVGSKFSVYAYRYIDGYMLNSISDQEIFISDDFTSNEKDTHKVKSETDKLFIEKNHEQDLIDDQERESLWEAMSDLDPVDWDILVQYHGLGNMDVISDTDNLTDLAKKHNMSIANVLYRKNRAMEELKKMLKCKKVAVR